MTETIKPTIRQRAAAAIKEVMDRRAAEKSARDNEILVVTAEGLIKAVYAMFGIDLTLERITLVGRPDNNPNCCYESATARCMIEGMEFGVCYSSQHCSVGYLSLIRTCPKCGEEVWEHVTSWATLGGYLQSDAGHTWGCVKATPTPELAPTPPRTCSDAEGALLDAFTGYINWLHAEAD